MSFQRLQHRLDCALDTQIARLPEAVAFHADHLNDLPPACDEFSKDLAVGVCDGTRFGTNAFREQRNHLSVERIGLGKSSGRSGEIAYLTRIDNRQRQLGADKRRRDSDLEPARCFKDDEGRRERAQFVGKLLEAVAVTSDGEDLARWAHVNIKTIL